MSIDNRTDARERGLARFAQRTAAATEKWFPDAYVFALARRGRGLRRPRWSTAPVPRTVVETFGGGFWDLTAFTLQMAMVVLTGYVVATSPPVARLIERIARVPSTATRRGRLRRADLVHGLAAQLGPEPGLQRPAGPRDRAAQRPACRLPRARRRGVHGSRRRLGARACRRRPRSCWRPPASIPPELLEITGVLDFSTTILTWQSLTMAAVLIVLTVAIAWASAPQGRRRSGPPRTWTSTSTDDVEPLPPRSRPGEWLEYSRDPAGPRRAARRSAGWSASSSTLPVLTVLSNLNGYLMVFLVLGPGAARHPARLPRRRRPAPCRRRRACWCSSRCTPRWRPS